jgi:Beta-lactamase enzyme family
VRRLAICLAAATAPALLAAPAQAPGGGVCAAPPAGWRADVPAARAWAAGRRGTVSFAVRTPGGLQGRLTRRTVPAASVLKAMLLVAYLDRPSVRGRALTRADRRLLEPMVRRSDNVTATRVRDVVGAAGLRRVARRTGMRHFRVHPIWGMSRTDAADQTRLFLRLERHVPARHRATALRLLRTIVPSQRWGIGRLRLPGWRLYFKGGWGSGTGRVDHQVALLRGCGDARLAVAVMTTAQGSHAYGKRTLEGVFRRLLRGLVAQ